MNAGDGYVPATVARRMRRRGKRLGGAPASTVRARQAPAPRDWRRFSALLQSTAAASPSPA